MTDLCDRIFGWGWTRLRALSVLSIILLAGVLLIPAAARARDDDPAVPIQPAGLCHAVSPVPQTGLPRVALTCGGTPQGFQHGSLWLRIDPAAIARAGGRPVVMLASSRFDRAAVAFGYADGVTQWQSVQAGDFGTRWRLGGQIAFEPPLRDAPLRTITLRFDHQASLDILRLRLVPAGRAGLESGALAAMVGATLILLAIGALYNIALGLAARRAFPLWQGAWSACMGLWGALWSQIVLFVWPALAGPRASQAGSVLAGLAMMLSAWTLLSAIDRAHLPRHLRRVTAMLGCMVALLALPLGVLRSGPLDAIAMAMGITLLVMLVAIAACLIVGWQRGSAAARDFCGAWAVPLIAMGGSGFIDTGNMFWGGGAQMLVLVATAWQTLWLSVAATRRFTRWRLERDRALQGEALAQEQARRDPLTGLRNRRGFFEAAAPLLAKVAEQDSAGDETAALALLLLDVDRFKSINDLHGHDVGDTVLVTIARRLERWDAPLRIVARMGGEEFAILVGGMGRFAAQRFAESVRQAIAALPHDPALAGKPVTVSIGLAMAQPGDDFSTLHRAADAALYEAKHAGRNRVALADGRTAPGNRRPDHPHDRPIPAVGAARPE